MVTGTNTIAVEIHQRSSTSSDISFDLELTGLNAIIKVGSEWNYLDDGSDQGTSWYELGFDDSDWSSGNAQLGYGDGDETTIIDYGGDPDNKYITTYFRK